ncbi:MAG: hypothetical protein ACLFRT_13895 [Actinomycetota bacterium]
MDFRSHLARPMDFRSPSNAILGILTLITAGIAVYLWTSDRFEESADILLAPVHVFVIWALAREIDPDHNWTALAAATATAVWALTGGPVASALGLAGLMFAARIVTSTTGRRPLPVDLAFASAFGIAIGFSVEGWVAGFGIALAIYRDDRFAEESRPMAVGASAVTAIGTTIVATLANAFPERLPDIDQGMVLAAGLAALALIAREPAAPISQVDARHAAFIYKPRLYVSRAIVGILAFLMTLLTGADAIGMTVVVAAMVLVFVSNEIELLRRPDL